MKRIVGAALLALVMAIAAGCGGASEQKGDDPAKPATTETNKSERPKPETQKPAADAKPGSGTYGVVAGESKASYEVKEVFLVEALNATAIGSTSAIKGELKLENGAFAPSTVVVDVTQLKSDRSMRDNVLKTRGLETATYPTAEFTVAGAEGGPLNLKEGQEANFKLTGKAKIHGVEKDLTWDATAKLEGGTLKLSATTEFKMELFEIEPPHIAGKIRVDETVKLHVDLVAKQ